MKENLKEQPARPQYIREQHNSNCQQFSGPISNCVFAMPGANVNTSAASKISSQRTSGPEKNQKLSSHAPKVSEDSKPDPERMTFRKCGILDAHIRLLYALMLQYRWIDNHSAEEEFLELFSGGYSDCCITWAGTYGKGTLAMLFCRLIDEGLIALPNGYTVSKILEGHFVDKKGKYLTNMGHGDPCAPKALPEIKEFIDILKTHISTNQGNQDCANAMYTDSYDSFDHQDLHLHRKH